MLAVLYCICFLLADCAMIRSLFPHTRMIARIWMGACFGLFLMMWLPYLAAFFVDFSLKAHVIALIAAVTAACRRKHGKEGEP